MEGRIQQTKRKVILLMFSLTFLVFTSYVGIESIQYAKYARMQELKKAKDGGTKDIPIAPEQTPIMTNK